ncbi:hypothetical protein FSP39_020349 [Pinctada imbricata]|uniref:Uncharacterized protein n=1 Tax=Pinctada imbricata TaxID=66713 RepID=A0AA88XIC5_PINIB|nr:hypothetical protein FSP39_020349 [Pinctada imbricata]
MDDSGTITFRTQNEEHEHSEDGSSVADENERNENVNEDQEYEESDERAAEASHMHGDGVLRSVSRVVNDAMSTISEQMFRLREELNDVKRTVNESRSENCNQNRFQTRRSRVDNMNDLEQPQFGLTPQINVRNPLRSSSSASGGQSGSNRERLGKMKPQQYDGVEDLNEYLTHFNIVAEINGWSYQSKSLHLAGSLSGEARSLLNDLEPAKQRDFDSVVEALNNRYGTINRAEVYKTELQTRVRRKGETIPELAQAITKLAKKAYPNTTKEMIEVLALDYFTDALTDSDIRLRLKEVGPKNISEAEKIAVRLEAYRLADKQRGKQVRVLSTESEKSSEVGVDLSKMNSQLENLAKEVKVLQGQKGNGQQGYWGQYRGFGRGRGHNQGHRQGYGSPRTS